MVHQANVLKISDVTVLDEGRELVSPEEFWKNAIRIKDIKFPKNCKK